MKIYPNTAKSAPLMEAIDALAQKYAKPSSTDGDWRVRLQMAAELEVSEESITEKDVIYFILRMGEGWLARKVRGIGATTAAKLYKEAQEKMEAQA